MSITVTDPALLDQLLRAADGTELRHPDGRVIGRFVVEELGKLPPGVRSPFTDEQRAERLKDRTGRPLADILRDLKARG
ncbi:MAG: hypothetical protein U0871_25490 [Gemmataceae bacterium]